MFALHSPESELGTMKADSATSNSNPLKLIASQLWRIIGYDWSYFSVQLRVGFVVFKFFWKLSGLTISLSTKRMLLLQCGYSFVLPLYFYYWNRLLRVGNAMADSTSIPVRIIFSFSVSPHGRLTNCAVRRVTKTLSYHFLYFKRS